MRNKSNRINIVFFLLMITLSIWSALMGSAYFSSNLSYFLTLLLTRLLTVPAFFFPSIFLYFTLVFPENTYKNKASFFVLHGAFILFFLSFLFSDSYIRSSAIEAGGINFKFGIIYLIFGAYLVVTMVQGCYILLNKFFILKGHRKHQIILFTIGALISITVGMIFAFILPAFNIYLNFLAPTGTLFCIGFLAYAIIKTRFMDIRIVITRLMAYLILTTIYLMLGTFFVYVYTQFLVFGLNIPTLMLLITLLFLGCISFHPLRLQLQTTPDKFLFRKKYLYEETIKELSEKCGSIVEFEELVGLFSKKIEIATKTKKVKIYLID